MLMLIRKTVCLMLLVFALIGGCAGREANPVDRFIPGDENRSCNSLKAELASNENEIIIKLKKDASKFWTNTLWFFITPLAMDTKGAEKTEAHALQQRNRALRIIIAEKNCK